jgi:mannose-1-phosphate guanylyltransferase/phosphomannomutase
MPNVMAKVNADILALNPYTSTAGMMAYDRDRAAAEVARLVAAAGADLGAVLSPDGERLWLVDDRGRVLDDSQSALCFARLVAEHVDGDRVAMPVTASDRIGDVLAEGGRSVLATKVSNAALMEAATEPGVGLALDDGGGFILPGLMPAFDGAAALVKLLEMLALAERPLSEIVDDLPPVHRVHETVVTPWDQKGTVMRTLVERNADREVEMIDGLKIRHDDGWVLTLPDPEEPVTHVWAEADSDERARALVQEYARRIRQMIR